MTYDASIHTPDDVLDFWFPDNGHWHSVESHRVFWTWRMQGGADADICARFGGLTEAAARGQLDHWASTPRGRLALIIALDQFPRSLWRDTPRAFGQDIKATRLALEGMQNGHWQALPNNWEKQFPIIAISHCEGPDHLARMEMLIDRGIELLDHASETLMVPAQLSLYQACVVRDIIARFGRHPHRNEVLGRVTTVEEAAYIAEGCFPHQRALKDTAEDMAQKLAWIEAMVAERRATS